MATLLVAPTISPEEFRVCMHGSRPLLLRGALKSEWPECSTPAWDPECLCNRIGDDTMSNVFVSSDDRFLFFHGKRRIFHCRAFLQRRTQP
jgi:hypothetical protein